MGCRSGLPTLVLSLLAVLALLSLLWLILGCQEAAPGRRRPRRGDEESDSDAEDDDAVEEPFEAGAAPAAAAPVDAATADAAVAAFDVQRAIDFSDVTVSEQQRREWQESVENAKQVQTVNERFDAAKRRTEEHKLKPGVFPNKKRRELVEALVRRPYCGRRARSWRTAFSDTMRGDVVPKNLDKGGMGMMRVGRSDPSVDLHPGALGPMSGLSGRWVSEENIPDNLFDDITDL